MVLTLSPQDAALLSGFLSSIVVPFATSRIKHELWPDWVKLSLAIVLSFIGGLLTAYAGGSLNNVTSIVAATGLIFAAAHVHFKTWFHGLGLEDKLNPEGALARILFDADFDPDEPDEPEAIIPHVPSA